MTGDLRVVADRLARAKKVLLTCHRGPDGDSVGSLVALASLLRERNVFVTLYNPDLVPRNLKWLPHARTFVQKLKKAARFDVTVIVDCGAEKLLGDEFPPAEVTGDRLVLDHHASGETFGDVFVCDRDAASVGVLVVRLARELGWPLSSDAAQGLWVSLVSDTGSFRYSNTNAEALTIAAELVALGVEPGKISERMTERATLGRYRLLAGALQSIELSAGGAVAIMTITDEAVRTAKATWEDSGGLVNYARGLRGVEVGALLTPAKFGGVRVSLRSKGRVDAGEVCKSLGGGGHVGAAGCTLEGTMPDARARVEAALASALSPADGAKST